MSLAGRVHLDALLALPVLQSLDLSSAATSPTAPRRGGGLHRHARSLTSNLSSNAFALKGTLPWAFLASLQQSAVPRLVQERVSQAGAFRSLRRCGHRTRPGTSCQMPACWTTP
ncbi:hypothetical protein C2845_PM14G09800 [Panicum miliaceum]|uniref:Secreted protein n=1 Tax=Panicum miliaceum TaxID=4540 RepID=A0A3L6PNX5_PANMI|nr:hypothetical protein C2845_PM14G09800 [Panicum miliaceum]